MGSVEESCVENAGWKCGGVVECSCRLRVGCVEQ